MGREPLDAEIDRPPLIDPELRSPDPATCPFLRAIDDEGRLGLPVEAVDPRNRCLATGTVDLLDAAQQQRACLISAHVSCARYLSGVAGPADPGVGINVAVGDTRPAVATDDADRVDSADGAAAAAGSQPRGRGARTLTPAVIAATVFLVASASAAIAFVAVRGGIELPIASPGPSGIAAVSPTPATTVEPTLSSPPSADPTASPTPASTPAPTPTPVATPRPTSDRYALLEPCPSTPNCYTYTVRTGDNLQSIASFFGVPYETVLRMNPQISDPTTIQPGDPITLPPPTR
ncbi:MAG: LysM peptidoglycan-binding domain-containing protein [Chloroflexota bacterium]|nr:MAG: LysM peptidoglycan-binding domain-containing protein [Chloroflexota bacterium]